MLTHRVWLRWPLRRAVRQSIVGVFAFRYDKQLVPDLLENLRPIIDGYIAWDDSCNGETWYHEGTIRTRLIEEAKRLGADWVLAVDPDERFERGAAAHIRALAKHKRKVIYGFEFRELYQPDAYRVDGIWGEKVRWNLYPLLPGQTWKSLRIHSPWFPVDDGYEWVRTKVNLYHLKMIDPKNRQDRRELYQKLDPNAELQPVGYDYLTDETGMRLERIPTCREYVPKYRESYGIRQTA